MAEVITPAEIIEFKFGLEQKVRTTAGDLGLIIMLAYNEGGNCYYIRVEKNNPTQLGKRVIHIWLNEDDLVADIE